MTTLPVTSTSPPTSTSTPASVAISRNGAIDATAASHPVPPKLLYQSDVNCTLTVVLPTRNEADNIQPLITHLEAALAGIPHELLFVDDSTDNTPEIIHAAQTQSQANVRLIHRTPEERIHGLGGAVLNGLHEARAPLVCIMDADLQHPPELLPLLLQKVQEEQADLVIGSRYQDGGNANGLNLLRLGISQLSDTVARLLFPKQLANISDPMTGFFMVRKNRLALDELHPCGFKILLEILIRTPELRVAEVPFTFGTRLAGESKAGLREGLRYLWHVAQLYIGEDLLRFFRFCLIGCSGIFVNLLLTFLFTDGLGLHYLAGAALGC